MTVKLNGSSRRIYTHNFGANIRVFCVEIRNIYCPPYHTFIHDVQVNDLIARINHLVRVSWANRKYSSSGHFPVAIAKTASDATLINYHSANKIYIH